MPKLHTFTAALPGGGTESRKSSRDLKLAVVAATRAGDRAVQLEASISEHRAEAEADLRNDGIRHPSIKEARRVASIRDAEVVADLERLRALRELPADELVDPFVWGWYEDEEAAARGAANARKVGHAAGIVAVDAPAPEWDLCISSIGGYSRPNAADEPGGTARQTKEHKMAKHINTATVRTAEGTTTDVVKTSTHRDYVAVSALELADGSQLVLSWHLTEAAAYKYIQTATVANMAARRGNAKPVVLPVANEVVLTKKEKALLDGANEIMAEQAVAAEADAVLKLSGEMVEVPSVALETAKAEAEAIEAPETETIVAPVEETPAPVKVRKPRAPKAAPAPAVEIAQPVLDEDWKVRAMGEYKAGDRVVLNDGRSAVVVGPGERKVETIKVLIEATGKTGFRYLKNIKPAS